MKFIKKSKKWLGLRSELKFMSESSAAMLLDTAYLTKLSILLVVFFILSVVFWSSITKVDEITRGLGKVIPSSRLQVVQNLEGGIVKNIFVKEGERVKAQQSILELDDTQFAAVHKEKELEYFSEMAKITRLKAEFKGKALKFSETLIDYPKFIEREQQIYRNRTIALKNEKNIVNQQMRQQELELDSVHSQLESLTKNYKLVNKEYELTQPLEKKGIVSTVQLIRLKQQVNETYSKMKNAEISIPKLTIAIDEIKSRLSEVSIKYEEEVISQLRESEVRFAQLNELRRSYEDRVFRTIIRSPVNGIIRKLHATTIGGVVNPGMDLVDIIPLKGGLLIEVKVSPRDIAFIRNKQEAVVKLTAYDFTIFGGLKGIVEHISADSIQNDKGEEFYFVKIKTEKSFFTVNDAKLPIMPGMQAEVDIITGKKSLMTYLIKPLLRTKNMAFTER